MFDSSNVVYGSFREDKVMEDEINLIDEADLKGGYARIANAYLLMTAKGRFTQRQRQVIDAVMVLTYGQKDDVASKETGKYQSKKTARASAKKLAELTGLTPQDSSSVLNQLIGMNVIKRIGSSRGEVGMNNKIGEWILPDSKGSETNKIRRDKQKNKNHSLNEKIINSVNEKIINSEPLYKEETIETILPADKKSAELIDDNLGADNGKPKKPKRETEVWQAEYTDTARKLCQNGKPWDELNQKQKAASVFAVYNKIYDREISAFTKTGELNADAKKILKLVKQGSDIKDFKTLFIYGSEMMDSDDKRKSELWGEWRRDLSTLVSAKFSGYLNEAREYMKKQGRL